MKSGRVVFKNQTAADSLPAVEAIEKSEMSMNSLILEAVAQARNELPRLRFLPERRYNVQCFPTIGQYDWVAGQVLYSLVRLIRPRRVIEFSTSSGYSTSFIALALEQNGTGTLESIDLNARAQAAAANWLQHLGVNARVRLHNGDVRHLVPRLLDEDVDLLFVDTLHSFDMAEWYLRNVLPSLPPETIVHIHDVMPPEARVRIHGGPPYSPEPPRERAKYSFLVKRAIWLLLHGRFPNPLPSPLPPREILPMDKLEVFEGGEGTLASFDGNYFEESVLNRELMRNSDPSEVVYLNRIADSLSLENSQEFAPLDRVGRTDPDGTPYEWNDALWCKAETLRRLAPPDLVRRLIVELRSRYYADAG